MWFTETPWPPIAICGVAAAMLAIAWFRNARDRHVFGVVLLGIVAIAIIIVERAIETDVETVERLQLELAEAVKQDDFEKVVSFLPKSNTVLRGLIKGGMEEFRVEPGLSITDDFARWNDDKTKIISHLRANGRVGYKTNKSFEGHIPTRWEFTWERNDDNEWKIVNIVRLNPMTGEQIDWRAAP